MEKQFNKPNGIKPQSVFKLKSALLLLLVLVQILLLCSCNGESIISTQKATADETNAKTEENETSLYIMPNSIDNAYSYIEKVLSEKKSSESENNFSQNTGGSFTDRAQMKSSNVGADNNSTTALQNSIDNTNDEEKKGSLNGVCDMYSKTLSDTLSSNVITRKEWIRKLTDSLSLTNQNTDFSDKTYKDEELFDCADVFKIAFDNGFINDSDRMNPYAGVTRRFASYTIVKALGYELDDYIVCADSNDMVGEYYLITAMNLGYFDFDDDNKANPNALVTKDEMNASMADVRRAVSFKGKKILAFGDSIMRGDGNYKAGIPELISKKYFMDVKNYSLGGATFGFAEDKSHISNQIVTALSDYETGDIILVNGGTNDILKDNMGSISDKDDYAYGRNGRDTFASGMEYAIGFLKDNYTDIPMIYISAHNMDFATEEKEIEYNAVAIDICKKWDMPYVDIFNISGFNCEDEKTCDTYTADIKGKGHGDSIHPNRRGYYKYYIPFIAEKMEELIKA